MARRDAEVQIKRLAEYQAPSYRVVATDLTFDIAEGATQVESRLEIVRQPGVAADVPLLLDGVELELLAVHLNGTELRDNEYQVDAESLTIHGMPERAELRVVTRIYPEQNTALEGLYKSGGMYCTQCEAEGFRRITYYQDRPDVLARFRTTIIADGSRYPVLLSNGNPVADVMLDDGRRAVTWEDPFPKPSYLFALVAGDLALLEDRFVTASGREVVLRIYSEPHNIDQCDYAMDSLKRAMRWDEEAYGREYDLDIFMIVAVDDFNMGAMENKGLNIFNTSCVLATPDTATDASYLRVEGVVAHEYFHNWSGNRVTCRDWFQLSLKEGFTVFRDAQFSGDMNSPTVKRIETVALLRAVQFAEDSSPLAHPVRPESYLEISNFYTATVYEKGSEVVGMLYTLLGPARFRAGSDLYFDRHDGEAATTDDFLAAMTEAGGVDLAQFRRWYEQAGTPVVTVESSWSDDTLTVMFSQSCPPTPGQPTKVPMHIPMLFGILDADGSELGSGQLAVMADDPLELRSTATGTSLLLHLRSEQCRLEVRGLKRRPVLSLLRGFSAPIRLRYERPRSELAFLVEHDVDGFARWDAMQTLWVDEIGRRVRGEADDGLLIALIGNLLEEADSAPLQAEPLAVLAAMLRVPDESYLHEQFATVDVDGIAAALEQVARELSQRYGPRWQSLHERHWGAEPYAPDPVAMARRSLAHAALGYRGPGLPPDTAAALLQRCYDEADNLSDRRAVLVEVGRAAALDPGLVESLLEDFLNRWRAQALVVNHWFSLQAASPLCDAGRIRTLAAHAAFDSRNPNKLRALYGTFAQQNHRRFHALDGSGYALLADAVLELDRSNPQIAARLTIPLTRWRRYDEARQRLMRGALERIATTEGLSKDLYEVASKGGAAD